MVFNILDKGAVDWKKRLEYKHYSHNTCSTQYIMYTAHVHASHSLGTGCSVYIYIYTCAIIILCVVDLFEPDHHFSGQFHVFEHPLQLAG